MVPSPSETIYTLLASTPMIIYSTSTHNPLISYKSVAISQPFLLDPWGIILRASKTPSMADRRFVMRSITAKSDSWKRKRISTMPSRWVVVLQDSTLAPISK